MTASSPTGACRAPAAARSSPTSPRASRSRADGGRTYTFQLRPGLRFSDGTPVRPEDFRASIERIVRLAAEPVPPYYGGIAGAEACSRAAVRPLARASRPTPRRGRSRSTSGGPTPSSCTSSPCRWPTCFPRARRRSSSADVPQPGTGPYTIAAFTPRRGVRLVRNPRFRSWSAEARPDGFPDAIDVTISDDAAAQVAAVQHGRADAVVVAGVVQRLGAGRRGPRARARRRQPRAHGARAGHQLLFLNVREPPFDDPRVRRALNYAIDRRHVVELAGGSGLAGLSCQIIPPGLPGYAPTCPYTRDATAGGGWSAPDLARARRLVAASGTRGARVTLLGASEVRGRRALRRRASCGAWAIASRSDVFADLGRYFDYMNDTRHHAQVGVHPLDRRLPDPVELLRPVQLQRVSVRHSAATRTSRRFCDPAVDAALRRRAGRPRPGGERALGRARPPGAGGGAAGPAVQPPQRCCWSPTASATRRCTSCSGRCSISSGSVSAPSSRRRSGWCGP